MHLSRIALGAALLVGTMAITMDAQAQGLRLRAGTMQAGGKIGIDVDSRIPKEGDSVTGVKLILNPEFSYFVIDSLALDAAVSYETGFGDLYEKSASTFSFEVGARYVIVLGASVRPYIGAHIGMGIDIPDQGDKLKTFVLSFPIGILFPLWDENVALDIGTRVNVAFGLDDGNKGTNINVPIGYLGVQAFFGP